jgi:large subunit ribosomal protein L29
MTARAAALDTLRALTGEELAQHLREQRGQLFQVRLQQTIGQVENHRQIRAIRMEIAHTMTVQVEIRLAAERGEPAPAPRPITAGTTARRGRRAASRDAIVAPVRSRRARGAVVESAETAAVSDDIPVEDAIAATEIEIVEPEATPATPRSRGAGADAAPAATESSEGAVDADEDDV